MLRSCSQVRSSGAAAGGRAGWTELERWTDVRHTPRTGQADDRDFGYGRPQPDHQVPQPRQRELDAADRAAGGRGERVHGIVRVALGREHRLAIAQLQADDAVGDQHVRITEVDERDGVANLQVGC